MSWAEGPSLDGKGEFQYVADPKPEGQVPELYGGADSWHYSTPKTP